MTDDAPRVVASASNARYRRLLALVASSRDRARAGVVVLEGVHLLQAWAARFGAVTEPIEVFVARRAIADAEIASWTSRHRSNAIVLEDRLFDRASSVEHGAGLLAVVAKPSVPLPAQLDDDAVYLDRVQDPGNVGTVLRSCAAAGVRRVLCAPGTAACWSPKVLRAAMGAHFALEIHEGIEVAELQERCRIAAIATDAGAPRSLYDSDLRAPTLWLLGNEGQGLAPRLRAWTHARRVSIPQTAAVESLNVGVAAALCLYEQWRQRGFTGRDRSAGVVRDGA
ncbi:MAG: RNA methyltransferase [Burkholderiaceae bacterium]|nr:RNA methyltransferase [Burkholderiaceae bacterium]